MSVRTQPVPFVSGVTIAQAFSQICLQMSAYDKGTCKDRPPISFSDHSCLHLAFLAVVVLPHEQTISRLAWERGDAVSVRLYDRRIS